MSIVIYTPTITNRLVYVLDTIFNYLGENYSLTQNNKDQFIINYSQDVFTQAINIFSSGLLNRKEVFPVILDTIEHNGATCPFPAPIGFDMPFDVFSAIFYYLSLYDFYLSSQVDQHSRPKKEGLISYYHNNYKTPIAEVWMLQFKWLLEAKGSLVFRQNQRFNIQNTVDIDNISLINYRKNFGNINGWLFSKKFDLNKLKNDKIIESKDPFNTLSFIQKHTTNPSYFLLLKQSKKNSLNSLTPNQYRDIFDKAEINTSQLGLHSSYEAAFCDKELAQDIEKYFILTGIYPTRCRAHYLRMPLPMFYRSLIKNNIYQDHSLGFYDISGFICGMSKPFYWFDLKGDIATTLILHPFVFMDATYQYYNPVLASRLLDETNILIENTKNVSGTYTTVLHNDLIGAIHNDFYWFEMLKQLNFFQ
jgi:hypothetical protein